MWVLVLVISVIVLGIVREIQHQKLDSIKSSVNESTDLSTKEYKDYKKKLKLNTLITASLVALSISTGIYLSFTYGLESSYVVISFLVGIISLYVYFSIRYSLTKGYYKEVKRESKESTNDFSRVLYR